MDTVTRRSRSVTVIHHRPKMGVPEKSSPRERERLLYFCDSQFSLSVQIHATGHLGLWRPAPLSTGLALFI